MEIEPRGRKRRQQQEEEARRGARNPVRRDARGHYEVDQQEIARPEYQELLEALYTHYERGARTPLPFEIFPVREVPGELLMQLVGGDVHTFIALMGSDPVMRQQLMPLVPQMVRMHYADVVLLIAMACDTPLIQAIQQVNEVYYDESSDIEWAAKYNRDRVQGPMGFWPHAEGRGWCIGSKSGTGRPVRSLPQTLSKALHERNIPALNNALRVNVADNWSGYLRGASLGEFSAKYAKVMQLRSGWYFVNQEGPYALPDASACYFSHVSAIRLCVEMLRVGGLLGLLWSNAGVRDGMFLDFAAWPTFMMHEKLRESWVKSDLSEMTGDGEYRWKSVSLFASELVAWLIDEATHANVYYQFRRAREAEEAEEEAEEPFSVDAAHLVSMMQEYERTREKNFELLGQRDPLYIELVSMDRLVPHACTLAGVRRCERWWFLLLRAIWEVTRLDLNRHTPLETDEPEEVPPLLPQPTGSRLCCSCRAERATRLDTRFSLPFCPAERCQRQVFSRLRCAGLWRPEQGGAVVAV